MLTFLVQQCATSNARETQVQIKHATFYKAMYVELLVLIENKVYLKNMLFDEVFDLKAHVILTHTWFFLVPLWCLKFIILKFTRKGCIHL